MSCASDNLREHIFIPANLCFDTTLYFSTFYQMPIVHLTGFCRQHIGAIATVQFEAVCGPKSMSFWGDAGYPL